jgi:NAD(P)-dependent dehydrogenase (short-subunit alcohol dehydrogenase family)
VIDGMIERGWGRIINISSVNGQRGQFGQTNYSTAKAGIHGFIRDVALELAEYGIRINAVAPGPIETERTRATFEEMRVTSEYSPHRLVPMRRIGTPGEIADAVLYLASDEASYITGVTLDVAGGR